MQQWLSCQNPSAMSLPKKLDERGQKVCCFCVASLDELAEFSLHGTSNFLPKQSVQKCQKSGSTGNCLPNLEWGQAGGEHPQTTGDFTILPGVGGPFSSIGSSHFAVSQITTLCDVDPGAVPDPHSDDLLECFGSNLVSHMDK